MIVRGLQRFPPWSRSTIPLSVCTARGSGPELRSSMEFRSRAWRLTFGASSVDASGAIAGIVKLLLPPRQSRGVSLGF
jgi:hypothetical protein